MFAPATETRALLEQFVIVLREHGPDSEYTRSFIQNHYHDTEFVRLAELSRKTYRETKC